MDEEPKNNPSHGVVSEKRQAKPSKAGMILAIIFLWPFILIVLLVYGLYLFFVGFPERKQFNSSLVKQKLGLQYKHSLFKDDAYELANALLERGVEVEIKHKDFYYIVANGKAYEFGHELYYRMEQGEVRISFDGDPDVSASDYLSSLKESNGMDTLLLLYVENCVAYDVEYDEPIVFNDERFIIGDSVNDFADIIVGRPNVPPALRNTLEVEVRFFSNVRKTFPLLATVNNVGYRPHFVVAGTEEYLGVQFLKSDLREFDQSGKAIVSLCFFESIDYSSLKPGVAFSIMEGPRAVGEGRVVGEIQRFEGSR